MDGFDTDVLIVGAGPAGLAAAIAARNKGFRVVVTDHRRTPFDKVCGEGLSPGAVEALEQLGVRIPREEAHPFRGIRFIGDGRLIEAPFRSGVGLGIRRAVLQRALMEHAADLGVKVGQASWPVPRAVARYVVGADGHHSSIRRAMGLDKARLFSRRFGFRRHFHIPPWSDFVEVYWADGFQLYITPVGSRLVNVSLLTRDSHLRLAAAVEQVPEVAARLRCAEPAGPEDGAVTASRRLCRVVTESAALIGDASGSVDAVCGEGLCLAFRQAPLLAEALAAGDLRRYQSAHERLRRGPAFFSHLLLMLDRHTSLRRCVFATLAARPHWLADLLAIHVEGIPALR